MAFENTDLTSPLPSGDPNIPAGEVGTPPLTGSIEDGFIWLVTNNRTGITYGATTVQLRAALAAPTPESTPVIQPAVAGPTYHGAVASKTPAAAAVQALTADQWTPAPRTVVVSCNGTYPCFAEPASYPVRTVIQDVNGYNITGDFATTTAFLSINGAAVNYRIYTHQNPQYDPSFTLSL